MTNNPKHLTIEEIEKVVREHVEENKEYYIKNLPRMRNVKNIRNPEKEREK